MIKPSELPIIAARTPEVIQKYGEKNLECVFEMQLALLMQSFGFIVVQTRIGERRVDLIAISSGSYDPITCIVEAKTSRSPYALPVKDERALKEYVQDIRRSLTSLPPLKFVLLVSGAAARSLPARLHRVEAE